VQKRPPCASRSCMHGGTDGWTCGACGWNGWMGMQVCLLVEGMAIGRAAGIAGHPWVGHVCRHGVASMGRGSWGVCMAMCWHVTLSHDSAAPYAWVSFLMHVSQCSVKHLLLSLWIMMMTTVQNSKFSIWKKWYNIYSWIWWIYHWHALHCPAPPL